MYTCQTLFLQNLGARGMSYFLQMPSLVPPKFGAWGMLSNLDPPKFGAWSMLYILYMPGLKPPNFGVLSMWCILHMSDLDPPIFWSLRYVVHVTHANLDPPKSEAWACCIFYTWPTLILQSSKIGACCILYTCPTLFLQILELEACCRFWTCPALIPQIMELGECCISYMPHCPTLILQTLEPRAYGPLGQMPYLNPSGGMDSLYWARSMPVNISTLVNVSLLQGQHPYRGTGWVGPARKPLLWRAASRPGTYPLCWEHCQVQYTLFKLQFIGTLSYTLPEFL